MHIGILVTNTDRSDFAKARASDGAKFTTLLQPLRPDWQFTPVQVVDEMFPKSPSEFDGYVIGGSPASVNGQEPWIANHRRRRGNRRTTRVSARTRLRRGARLLP